MGEVSNGSCREGGDGERKDPHTQALGAPSPVGEQASKR